MKKEIDVNGLKRFEENGYHTIHLFGRWYLVRHKSKNYTKVSYYVPYKLIKEDRQRKALEPEVADGSVRPDGQFKGQLSIEDVE